MRRVLALPSGRRAKWVVLFVWLVVLVGAGPLAGRFESVQKNENSSFLPGSAELVKALDAIKRFPSGELTPVVVVVRRAQGLSSADRAEVKALAGTLTRIDYNVFLMTRVREEAAQHGTREGTKRALAVTGG